MPRLELRIPPVVVTLSFAGLVWLLDRFVPAPSMPLPDGVRVGLAAALATLGAGIALAGVVTFRKHRTTSNPLAPSTASAMVTSGVYRMTRNPMYLGFLIALTAWSVLLGTAWALLVLPSFVAYLTRFQIRPEERALRSKFGPEFERYTSRVRRWV